MPSYYQIKIERYARYRAGTVPSSTRQLLRWLDFMLDIV